MRLGVDLGGTKIEAIALDDGGATLTRRRVATPVGDYAATLTSVAELIKTIERDLSRKGSVGIGCPGALSPRTGLIKNANSTVLNGKPLDKDLCRILDRPIRLENDANCFALSEAVDGAGRHENLVFGIILGTGVGGGLVVDKAVIRGRNRITGEWGHNPLPWPKSGEWPGPQCYCGKTGCIETFLSGTGLSRDYEGLAGQNLSAAEISLAASMGDAAALQCLALYQDRLARALAAMINIVDPDAIVLGGGLSNIENLYGDLGANIERYVFTDAIDTKIYRAVHGDSSGVRGAAWLWPKDMS
ncbi:MAG: ROK family protein [Beijerinckiaceae bacterium]